MLKLCKKCNVDKELHDFYTGKNSCKECNKISFKINYQNNRDKKLDSQKKYYHDNKDLISNYKKSYSDKNSEELKAIRKSKYDSNPEVYKKSSINYYNKNKDKINENRRESKVSLVYYHNNKEEQLPKIYNYRKKKMAEDSFYKFKHQIRNLVRGSLKRKYTNKSRRTIEILGCTFEEFRIYIEGKFDSNMSWENQGTYWHLDHIKPISIAKDEEEVYELNHYTNFQPLYWRDNLTKGNKYEFG